MSDITARQPAMLAVAHGTENQAGLQANADLIRLVRQLRPELAVSLCWLDIASPTLQESLASLEGPVVVVPVLLSTGYHVKKDIPAVIAGRAATVQARHLGPDPRVVEAVLDRLTTSSAPTVARSQRIVLVGSGSSDPEARTELQQAAGLLAALAAMPVGIGQLTDADPLAQAGPDDVVASYLLAPGYFANRLRQLADPRAVSDALGAHPLLAHVLCDRYDEAVRLLP